MKAEQNSSHNIGIDTLKCICAFLVVCIHCPFPGVVGEYFVALARIAVPIFFIITGFFRQDIKENNKERREIKKIFVLVVEANILYLMWQCIIAYISSNNIRDYLLTALSIKNIIEFFIFNESPFYGHLWYLSAILYVLLIMEVVQRFHLIRSLGILVPVLLIGDLVLGKYSLLLFHREFSYIITRNWLFVGIPYYFIGMWIKSKADMLPKIWTKKRIIVIIIFFSLTTLLERYLLVSTKLNPTRDHYMSTTFLAIAVFLFFLLYMKQEMNVAARIGRYDSKWIYIVHPIVITILRVIANGMRLESVYNTFKPVAVFIVTSLFVIYMRVVINKLKKMCAY